MKGRASPSLLGEIYPVRAGDWGKGGKIIIDGEKGTGAGDLERVA